MSMFEETPTATYRVLETLETRMDEAALQDLTGRLSTALHHFDALRGDTVTVGLLHEDADAQARAWGHNRLFAVPPDEYTTNVTLYHELAHLEIRARNETGADLPKTSERFCGIYGVAAMPTVVVDEQRVPYLKEPTVSKGLLPHICSLALEYREEHHDYIQQCNRWITEEEDYREFGGAHRDRAAVADGGDPPNE